MSNELGFGALLRQLGGNRTSVAAWTKGVGQTITTLRLDPEYNGGDGGLVFDFANGSRVALCDRARSCCEHRYMQTDDDLTYHVGAVLMDASVRYAAPTENPDEDGNGNGAREVAFLVVTTSRGGFTVATYNEHNGYYGGIEICAEGVS